MNILHKIIAVLAIYLACAGLAQAQNASSQTVNEGATISAPIRLFKDADLNWGGIVTGTNQGNVVVAASGANTTRTFPADVNGPAGYGGTNATYNVTPTVARLHVTGEPNLSFAITVSGGTTITHPTAPVGNMSVVLGSPTGAGTGTITATAGTLSSSGQASFSIGGTLTVGANQVSGVYSGSFTVLVCYN